MNCSHCNTVKRAEDSKFCSTECKNAWNLMCKVCRKRPRIGRKFCSDDCRHKLQSFSRVGYTRPICELFLENGTCDDGERCFGQHEITPSHNARLIVPVPKTHLERVTNYVQDNMKLNVVASELGYSPTQSMQARSNLFINHPEMNDDTNRMKTLACTTTNMLLSDPVLERVVTRVFYTDSCAYTYNRLIKQLSLKIFGTKSCRLFAYPRSLIPKILTSLEHRQPKEDDAENNEDTIHFTREEDFQTALFVFQAGDNRLYYGHLDVESAMGDCDAAELRLLRRNMSRKDSDNTNKVVSRAAHKISEAVHRAGESVVQNSCAIDIGSSPGGWSYYLATMCKTVISVDPGLLAEPIPSNVIHYRAKVENCCQDIIGKEEKFDVLVCDMNAAPLIMFDVAFLPFEQHLNDNALIILTCKRLSGGKNRKPITFLESVHALVEKLKPYCHELSIFHLMANREHERTVMGRYKGIQG